MQYLKDTVRDKIYAAAVEEFKTFGYQEASIRNIANNAGISLGNIYRYYQNKEALYIAVVQPLMESVKEFVQTKFFVDGASLKEVAGYVVEFMDQHDDEIVILRRGNTDYYRTFSEFLEKATASRIEQGMHAGREDYKVKNPQLANIIARAFLHCLFDIIYSIKDKAVRTEYVEEVMIFYFGHLDTRLG
ncbi:MAG: TetR/AcrR family transcriptional regulator [Clostridia bacterium]|nr:TetR/AcrR family transcriptional regulator [Clostridia bacterium]